jgi:hypothetical protein
VHGDGGEPCPQCGPLTGVDLVEKILHNLTVLDDKRRRLSAGRFF